MRKGRGWSTGGLQASAGRGGSGTSIRREQDGGPVWWEEVDGIGALASPIQPSYAGFICVGVLLSESKHHRRRRRAGYVHLRRIASPAGLGGGRPIRLMHTPAFLDLALTRLAGLPLRDVMLTREEVDGLIAGLPTPSDSPARTTRFGNWLHDNAGVVGRQYVSDLRRNFRR